MSSILPLGSVVRINGCDNRLMIYGRLQKSKDGNTIYDYAACEYPIGVRDTNKAILFNGEAIKEIYFVGFQDVEELNYQIAIRKYLNEQ